MLNKKALAASVSAPPAEFVEDVFSTYLYDGNSSTQTITNGIDLASKGGLVWLKKRNSTGSQHFFDTVRGNNFALLSNSTSAQIDFSGTGVTSFNSSGFSIGSDGGINNTGQTFCSWTFREQPKFMDVVSYTGTGSNTTILHDLGSVPGMIIVKRTDTTENWQVYHRANTANPETDYLVLNTTAATADSDTRWNDTLPTSTVFSLGTDATVNASGGNYVAYLFAHDAGGFGTAGTDNVISCGSFTSDGSENATVSLGYEPQYVMYKRSSGTGDWRVVDVMRDMSITSNANLFPNLSNAEAANNTPDIKPNATGFTVSGVNASSNFIYMAIRRPMKVPTTGTQVYKPLTRTGTGATANVTGVGFSPDLILFGDRAAAAGIPTRIHDRLRGPTIQLRTSQTDNEFNFDTSCTAIGMDGITLGDDSSNQGVNASGVSYGNSYFKRASGFFDIVCYTGTGSNRTVDHNLTVAPELMIVKKRSAADDWAVYAGDNTDFLLLNTTAATADDNTYWNDTSPTSTVFSVGTNADVNTSAATYVAYLFASLTGVSKVGSYTGTAAAQTINCGFTSGARFVLIKRTDSTGDWYVWDTARGIVSGDDPYLLLNSTAAEVTNTDYIDPVSSGFELSSTAPAAINASGGNFIFLAVA